MYLAYHPPPKPRTPITKNAQITALHYPAQPRSRFRLSLAIRRTRTRILWGCPRELGLFVWSAVMAVKFVPPKRLDSVVTRPHAHVSPWWTSPVGNK